MGENRVGHGRFEQTRRKASSEQEPFEVERERGGVVEGDGQRNDSVELLIERVSL